MHPIQIQTNMDLCENCQIDKIGGNPDGSDKKDKSRSADALASASPVPPKKLSEILEKNVSTFETGFAATISSETFDNMLYDVVVKYQRSNQATEERSMLHQSLGKGPDGSGCSYITFDLAHIRTCSYLVTMLSVADSLLNILRDDF